MKTHIFYPEIVFPVALLLKLITELIFEIDVVYNGSRDFSNGPSELFTITPISGQPWSLNVENILFVNGRVYLYSVAWWRS